MVTEKNDKYYKDPKFFIELMLIIISAVAIFITLREQVCRNSEYIIMVDGKAIKADIKATTNKEELIEMRTDLKYIKAGIDEIKNELKNSP